MLTYNALLYKTRTERNLSVRKMAKEIGISTYFYRLIERGYAVPNKKETQKISDYLGIDYSRYLYNEPSYPADLPEKEKHPIVKWGFRVLGHIAFKITFIILSLLSIAYMVSGFVVENNYKNNLRSFYDEDTAGFLDRLQENGLSHVAVVDALIRPEYRYYVKDEENKTSEYIYILGSYDPTTYNAVNFNTIYRTEDYRLMYNIYPKFNNGEIYYEIIASCLVYSTSYTITATLTNVTGVYQNMYNYISTMDEKGTKETIMDNDIVYEFFFDFLMQRLDYFESDFNYLIAESDPLFLPDEPSKFILLSKGLADAQNRINAPETYSFIARYLGLILSGGNIFIVIYAILYGTKKGVAKDYRPAKLDIPVTGCRRLKTDIKFGPFLPETLLEIIGIILVFFGSFRVVIYMAGFMSGSLSTVTNTGLANNFTNIFMVGMFLLYFIDFDIFLEDKRVFRNIFMYFIIFICLFSLENMIIRMVDSSSLALTSVTQLVMLPNVFGSVCCYYLIMFFLFYTPKKITKKSTLILYRCCSILPVAIIFTTWFLKNGYNVLFTASWPIELRSFFSGEKAPFSLLAITYLFGLYFLRLYYEKKHGKEKAQIFFNGNRFIWAKNIMICGIVIIIALCEFLLMGNSKANKLGLGLNPDIIFLVPLFLFYHPHKGPRNVVLDWTTLVLYMLAIGIAYIIVAALALIYFI